MKRCDCRPAAARMYRRTNERKELRALLIIVSGTVPNTSVSVKKYEMYADCSDKRYSIIALVREAEAAANNFATVFHIMMDFAGNRRSSPALYHDSECNGLFYPGGLFQNPLSRMDVV